MIAIVAVDKNWGIGKNNDLLFSIPEDMAFFRKTTMNKVVVMGSRTLKSFPSSKPLKNRINVILSKTLKKREDCVVVQSIDELKQVLSAYNEDDVFLIGGAMMYNAFMQNCSKAYVTKVDADGQADTFINNLDEIDGWEQVSVSEPVESNGYTIRFTQYNNFKVKNL